MSKFIKCTDDSQLPCDVYFVSVNGNELVGYSSDEFPSLRCADRISAKGDYVELWYKYCDERCYLIKYWN